MATLSEETTAAPAPSHQGGENTQIDRALLVIASVVILGTVMSILDTTVVNVAINTLKDKFHTTLPTIQWVSTGYTLALATVIPLSGWAADRFGTKRIYMISIGLFVIGSALSGLAQSAGQIIVFRVLQGLGGGMIMPVGMTILTKAAGPQRIGRVMGVIGVPMLIGPILGPVLGGWLVSDVSWRWIFFINAPLGIFAILLSQRVLAKDVGVAEERLDLVDLFLASPGIALLIFGFAQTDSGGFGQAKVLIPIAVGLTLLVAFVRHALSTRQPLIDLRLFVNRVFSTASLSLVLVVIGVFGAFLLLPLYLQEVRGASPLKSGLLLIPQGVGSMIMMPVAGMISDRTGIGRIVPVGLTLIAVSMLWLTGLGAHTAYWKLEIDLFIMGVGLGLSMMPIFTGAIQTIKSAQAARASALLNILQQAAASVGTAVLTVALASAIAGRLTRALGAHAVGAASNGSGFNLTSVPAAARSRAQDAAAAGYAHTFWLALGLTVVALIASLFLPKHKPELPDGQAPPPVVF